MITANLTVRNLEQAWLGVMREIMTRGREYRKDDSTRAGMLRKALDWMSVTITHPEERPLVPLSKPGCISTCSEADAEQYLLTYLYTNEPPSENEHYTYAQWLMSGIDYTVRRYAEGGFYTQKAIMSVGQVFDDMLKCIIWLAIRRCPFCHNSLCQDWMLYDDGKSLWCLHCGGAKFPKGLFRTLKMNHSATT